MLKEFLTTIGVVAGIFLGIAYSIIWVADWYGEYQCNNYTEVTGSVVKWAPYDTCYVMKDGQYYRWDEYKRLFIAKETFKGAD